MEVSALKMNHPKDIDENKAKRFCIPNLRGNSTRESNLSLQNLKIKKK